MLTPVELLEQRSAEDPAALAFDDGLSSLSYGDLRRLVSAVARTILEANPPAGPVVLAIDSPSLEAAAVIACAVAGRACLPLDPSHPPARNRAIIHSARASILLTDHDQAADPGLPVVSLSELPPPLAEPLRSRLAGDAPAYLLPTSGSTGQPKLIALSQVALLSRATALGRQTSLTPSDRTIAGVPSTRFYPGLSMFLMALGAGVSLWTADPRREGLRGFIARLATSRVTIMRAAPSLWRAIADLNGLREALCHLRMVRFAGEPPLWSDIARLRPVVPDGCQFMNTMGRPSRRI